MSPMEHTLAYLRRRGWEVARTEHWNHFAKRRQDLFGFIDVLAVNDSNLVAIQTTDGSHHAEHVAKILGIPVARQLVYHMDIEIWSWSLKLTGQKRLDGKLHRGKQMLLRRDSLTARLLPKGSLLRREIEDGTWELPLGKHTPFGNP